MRRDGNGWERGDFHRAAANDNHGSKAGPEARIDDAVMRLGRQIAREQFDRPDAANDNAPQMEAHDR